MKFRYTFLLLFFVPFCLSANNIELSNVSLTGQNTANAYTLVQFDLSWENSWRISVGPANWDAAWVFVKYRVNGDLWRHATLDLTGATAPAGVAIDVVSDQTGAFIHRSADGSGDVNWQNLQLRWNYGANGVDDNDLVDIQVFAIEMVYVPEGAYYVGTNNGLAINPTNEVNEFYTTVSVPPFTLTNAYQVTSEAQITVGTAAGQLYYFDNNGTSGDRLGPIPATFPKAFQAYYCMKYEASEDQWIGFFNSLTQTQKVNMDITDINGKNVDVSANRNSISWLDAGAATSALPNIPITYVRNYRMLAYLDWAGLRPMTELEYEKACRGPLTSVANEYAWGTSNIHNLDYTLSNADTPAEVLANPGTGAGNAAYAGTMGLIVGMVRCGIFPASALLNNREETGGSYYGIMELSGNVYERVITVGNPEGRAYTGTHGDGVLTGTGNANVTSWPTGDAGLGYRGGSHNNGMNFLRVSDRFDGSSVLSGGNDRIGFRGVRTAE